MDILKLRILMCFLCTSMLCLIGCATEVIDKNNKSAQKNNESTQIDSAKSERNKEFLDAVANGSVEHVKSIINAGKVNINSTDTQSGMTALMIAVSDGYTSIVEALIKAGAKPDVKEGRGYTALDLAKDKA